MAAINNFLLDGVLEFSGGVDGNRSPAFLEANQSAFAINTSMRGGKLQPRPALRRVSLSGDANTLAALRTGRFQHASFYDGNERPSLMVVSGGRVFRVNLDSLVVTEVTPEDNPNSPNLLRGWSVQAENYWIYQDNQSLPLIYDGSSCRRANPSKSEVPVGNVMAYAMGRLIVSLPDRKTYRVGDLVFGPSGTPEKGYRDAMLRFTENDYLNEGGDFIARVFGAPSGYGPITSMTPVAMSDTQLGQGPVLVGTPNMVFTLNLPFDRDTWKNLQNSLLTVSPIIGPVAPDATVLVNGDVWYRSLDGIRSYIMARRDFTSWGNSPMSAELNALILQDSPQLLEFASAVLFDNRLLCTCSPASTPEGIYHRGLVALDFNLISSMRGRSAPAWEGIWNGLNIYKLVKGTHRAKERCFLWCRNASDEIDLWEMLPEQFSDEDEAPIQWSVDLRSMNFQNGFGLKRLESAELFIDEVRGDVAITAKYRPDQYPCFLPWDSTSLCAKDRDCMTDLPACQLPRQYQPQFRSKIKFHQPPDTKDVINRRRHRTGYEFQARLEITGYCHVKQVRILAVPEPEATNAERTHL